MDLRRTTTRVWNWLTRAEARRTRRRAALLADTTAWDLSRIATELGVSTQTTRAWVLRRQQGPRAGISSDPMPLPAPARDGFWRAGTVRRWAMQTGRMNPDGELIRRQAPGRPRPATATAVLPPASPVTQGWIAAARTRLRPRHYVLAAVAAAWATGVIVYRHLFIQILQTMASTLGALLDAAGSLW